MPGTGLFDSSDDDFVVGPPLDQRVIDGVMEKLRTERVQWDEKADKKLQKMMNVIIMLTITVLVMTIALACLGYVLYNNPVTIVINVDPASGGQCPFEDDFEEPVSGQTQVTEHYMFQDTFQQASVLAMSVMKSKNFIGFAVGSYFVTFVYLVATQTSP